MLVLTTLQVKFSKFSPTSSEEFTVRIGYNTGVAFSSHFIVERVQKRQGAIPSLLVSVYGAHMSPSRVLYVAECNGPSMCCLSFLTFSAQSKCVDMERHASAV